MSTTSNHPAASTLNNFDTFDALISYLESKGCLSIYDATRTPTEFYSYDEWGDQIAIFSETDIVSTIGDHPGEILRLQRCDTIESFVAYLDAEGFTPQAELTDDFEDCYRITDAGIEVSSLEHYHITLITIPENVTFINGDRKGMDFSHLIRLPASTRFVRTEEQIRFGGHAHLRLPAIEKIEAGTRLEGLKTISFAGNSRLKEIEDGAYLQAFKEIALPETIERIGTSTLVADIIFLAEGDEYHEPNVEIASGAALRASAVLIPTATDS